MHFLSQSPEQPMRSALFLSLVFFVVVVIVAYLVLGGELEVQRG